ncbi:MAG: haloacid dehalogenase [Pseudonocardiaceae bacterium]|nr:haloacid dehalogenase [Pseudonocardiaceae bacterium]
METLLALEPLRQRFVDVGRPGHELDVFFARTLRDGMAFTLAGQAPPFRDVARAELRTTSGLDEDGIDHVLRGFGELPAQPDAERALALVAEAGIPAYAFTHGSAAMIGASMARSPVFDSLRGVLSSEEISAFKPPARTYHWACQQAGSQPHHTALIAVHSWDTHGALRAGLLAGFATRLEGRLSEVVDRPQVVAERLDEVVEGLLALPSAG